jgi:hypothetical protein
MDKPEKDSLILAVRDDILDDPDSYVDRSKLVNYWPKETHPDDIGFFPGIRSMMFHQFDERLFQKTMEQLEPVYNELGLEYLYGKHSYSFSKLREDSSQIMHRDSQELEDDEICFAGVIYLNPNPPNIEESGTHFILDNELKKINNRYNRLVIYGANITHSPGPAWGETWDDCRMTITLSSVWNIKDKKV